ncbi:MAG: UDP-N-acetylmuramoyl-L-alanine--D-glutamate ligase [Candidatus Pacebacteria bacterium]|nr:UDP-N-acetylmuramoyl-L-alanine--D-glutamate ligase [Candidatus Paceibacterota bacterium]
METPSTPGARYGDVFSGRRITQMGLGVLGRGVGDAEYMAKYGAELLVTDLKEENVLATSVERLKEYPNVRLHLGGHTHTDFEAGDLVLKGAGVPFDSEYIAHAYAHGVPVDMSASLFARITQIPLLGVTGTRGKSTITHLLHSILQAEGRETLLGGNVLGVSNLALLDVVSLRSIGVFELDSWQCQGFGEECSLRAPSVRQGPLSPSLAVFASFMSDHMNYYRGDMERYLADKAHIFMHQSDADVLVLGRQAVDALRPYKTRMRGAVIVADASDVPRDWHLRILGEHNRYNAGIAIAAARAFGIDDEVIRGAVEGFEALPGRTQLVREVAGVRFYNDTNATTPDAVLASVKALDPEGARRVVLIAGGVSKGLDMSGMAQALRTICKHTVLLPGSGTDALLAAGVLSSDLYTHSATLDEAFVYSRSIAVSGDIILFSPGCASHNLFRNEYDRGEKFVALVRSL